MTVILIVATFTIFLLIDYFYSKRRGVLPVAQTDSPSIPAPRFQPAIVAGFRLPENVRYHPGHTWALSESPKLVRIGMDDFAARLLGKVTRINLPQRGQWIRQGQKIASLYRDGNATELVSPIEGMVTDVNQVVLQDPEASRRDPYGDGWLLTVQSPDASTNFRNLLGGGVARRWMEEAAARLRAMMPAVAGAVAQDGGLAVDDLVSHLPDQKWTELTREFFLT
jgi:glycine cleavage system H lipoate-binding protein